MSSLFQSLRRHNFFLFDIYIFQFLFSYGLQLITINFLVQDKICRTRFNQSEYFCQHIHEDIFDGSEQIIKDRILASTALYNNYSNLIQAIPMFIWSLFFGSFLDRQTGATRMIFAWINILGLITTVFYLVNIFNFLIDPYMLLLAGLHTYLTGGMATFLTVTHRYVVINTDPEHRSLRFTIFQIYLLAAITFGQLLGGNLIHLVTDSNSLQLRNYDLNMWIVFALNIFSFIMILIIPIDRQKSPSSSDSNPEIERTDKDIDNESITDNDNDESIDKSNPVLNGDRKSSYSSIINTTNESIESQIESRPISERRSLCYRMNYVCRTFFDMENVRQTYRCLTKSRMNRIREQIIFLIILLVIQFLNYLGLDSMFLQFSQKVYQFDAKTFANVNAISKAIPNIGLFISSQVLVRCLKLKDGTIMAITLTAGFLNQILIGTFTNVIVYFIALIIGSMSGLSTIILKTEIAKLIPKDEVGKIFSVISTFESLAPFVGTLIFSTIFSASVTTYPTLIYHVGAAITLLCLIMALFHDLYFHH
ncbi:uncharacterized protein LOC113795458 isoform X1 [Dermatophagoides pteronyssinus]|uniref:Uncharacterized protein LOC113795458 n=2 Tax=Dermatophagoides pteronyssinus TaxID=6956 RepID=A0A6P6Y815_DERPT|nr:uncharacterized protein LOC113795458 [Dermatophagoides pteronyssinus]